MRKKLARLNDPMADGFILLQGGAGDYPDDWSDTWAHHQFPCVTIAPTGGGRYRLLGAVSGLDMMPAEGMTALEVAREMRKLMQSRLSRHKRATMWTPQDTLCVMDGLTLEAAKELGREIAGLTGKTFPLEPVEGFAAA